MGSEKRVLIAFVLSFAVLMVWQAFLVKKPPHPAAPAQQSSQAPKEKQKAPEKKTPEAVPAKPKPPAPVQLPVEQGSQARDIVVENNLYKITFSTQGGVVKSWILKKFHDEDGKPLDVVNQAACKQMGYPLSISMQDAGLAKELNEAIYVPNQSAGSLQTPVTLEFEYSNGKVRVRKKFSLGSDYEVHAEVSVFNGQRDVPVDVVWPGGLGDHSVAISKEEATSQAFYESAGKLETVAEHKIKEQQTISGPLTFAGLEDRYFAGVFFPESQDQAFRFEKKSWSPKDWKGKGEPAALVAMLGTSDPHPLAFRLFVAPKQLELLDSTVPPTTKLVNFGWFGIIARPLFLVMRYVYDHWVHNYGWVIVILTFILNMAFFPLKIRQIRSAQEMQRIQPLVKAIQDRYKQYKFNDPRKQRMNQEVMKLYQEHHINPLGGCLPMLPQLPILYGFYESLEAPFAFRHAPWILWIKDLSQADPSRILGLPIPILPTIMVVAFYFSTKMTPMPTADPAQQRMMTIMPIFMGILFFRLPSGMVLYMLAMSIVGILQQLLINRYFTPTQPLAPGSQKAAGANA